MLAPMDIAAMSIMLNQLKVQQQASISVMKIAMDSAKGQAIDMWIVNTY